MDSLLPVVTYFHFEEGIRMNENHCRLIRTMVVCTKLEQRACFGTSLWTLPKGPRERSTTLNKRSAFIALAAAGMMPIAFTTTALAASAPPLKHVLANTNHAPYQQESLVQSETIKYLGQTIQVSSKSVFHVEILKHQLTEYGTVTETAQGTTKRVHVFIKSGVEYANTGSGWTVVGKLGANAVDSLTAAQDGSLKVTQTKRTKTGYQYVAKIDPAALASALQSTLGTLSTTGANAKVSSSTAAALLKDASGTTTVDTRLINKYWRIRTQTSVVSIPVSAAVLSKLTGVAAPASSSVTSKVYGTGGTKPKPAMTILVRERMTLSYAKKPVSAPKGLPKK